MQAFQQSSSFSPTTCTVRCRATLSQLKEGNKALDVGSGSGYLTACFAHMVGPTGKVVGIDHIQNLVDWSENNLRKNHGNLIDSGQIKLVLGDGRLGYDQDGPYHAIHVGAAAAELPQQVRIFFF